MVAIVSVWRMVGIAQSEIAKRTTRPTAAPFTRARRCFFLDTFCAKTACRFSNSPASRAQSKVSFGLREVIAAIAEVTGAALDAPGDLVLDGLEGEVELAGGFGLGEPLEFVEEKDGTGLVRQGREGIGQEVDLFLMGEAVDSGGTFIYNTGEGQFPPGNEPGALFSAEQIEGQIAGDGEEESLGGYDFAGCPYLPDAEI